MDASNSAGSFIEQLPDYSAPFADIIRATAVTFNVFENDIYGRSRQVPICQARNAVALLAIVKRGLTHNQVAMKLGRDHSTLVNARQQGLKQIGSDQSFADRVRKTWDLCGKGRHAIIAAEQERIERLRQKREAVKLQHLFDRVTKKLTLPHNRRLPTDTTWTKSQLLAMNERFDAHINHFGEGYSYA